METTKSRELPCPTDYLSTREHCKIQYHKWDNHVALLLEEFNCEFIDLEEYLLEARTTGQAKKLIDEYTIISAKFNEATTLLDCAKELQRKRMLFDKDVKTLDC